MSILNLLKKVSLKDKKNIILRLDNIRDLMPGC